LFGLGQIRQYQWVQSEPGRIVLRLVAEERLEEPVLATIRTAILRDLDAQMHLQVDYLDAIPRTDSGKHRFVIGLADRDARRA
jgi:hypothetical protein